jgi:hypothetical protein
LQTTEIRIAIQNKSNQTQCPINNISNSKDRLTNNNKKQLANKPKPTNNPIQNTQLPNPQTPHITMAIKHNNM